MTVKDLLALLAILACYGIAGRLDYEDTLRLEAAMRDFEEARCARARPSTPAETLPTANDFVGAALDGCNPPL